MGPPHHPLTRDAPGQVLGDIELREGDEVELSLCAQAPQGPDAPAHFGGGGGGKAGGKGEGSAFHQRGGGDGGGYTARRLQRTREAPEERQPVSAAPGGKKGRERNMDREIDRANEAAENFKALGQLWERE